MSFANPTPIRLGMTGTFNGRNFRVAGRIVMGMEDGGETYYWNEFNLVDDAGDSATLVYEETERGGEWRLFTLFEVEYPLTAADAATKRVGDRLTLDDSDVRITLVDESRVYHIEGRAPEGVEKGDVAHYFNAETSQRMIVVSWTGDEVEYYRGATLSVKTIALAFNLSPAQFQGTTSPFSSGITKAWPSDDEGRYLSARKFFRVVCFALVFMVLVAFVVYRQPGPRRGAVRKTAAPAASLQLGSAGTLEGKSCRVAAHAVAEIAQFGRHYDRHEYLLLDDGENRRLLIQGLRPGDQDWILFTPFQPTSPLRPAQAASLRAGTVVNLDDLTGPVGEVSQVVLRQSEGGERVGWQSGTLYFSFATQSGTTPVLVRWNQDGIEFFRGQILSRESVQAAFSQAGKA